MGMFDGIVGSIVNLVGGAQAADKAHDQDMAASNTSYQRAVKDMKAAGLNPMLAYSKGGASTPSSPVAQVPDFNAGITAGSARQVQAAQTEQIKATTEGQRLANAQAALDLDIRKKTGTDPKNPVNTSILGALSGQMPVLNSASAAFDSIKPDWWSQPIWKTVENAFSRDSAESPVNSAKSAEYFRKAVEDLPMFKTKRLNDSQLKKKYGWLNPYKKGK